MFRNIIKLTVDSKDLNNTVMSCGYLILQPEDVMKYIKFSDDNEIDMGNKESVENEYIGRKYKFSAFN